MQAVPELGEEDVLPANNTVLRQHSMLEPLQVQSTYIEHSSSVWGIRKQTREARHGNHVTCAKDHMK